MRKWSITVNSFPQIDPTLPRHQWKVIGTDGKQVVRMDIFSDDSLEDEAIAKNAVNLGLIPKGDEWELY
jgi:hypothetical protein